MPLSPEHREADCLRKKYVSSKRRQHARQLLERLAEEAWSSSSEDEPETLMEEGRTNTNSSAKTSSEGTQALNHVMEDEAILQWWVRTSGLHTVQKWVSNYRKHPAGWAALFTIQGIPEVTGRLRSKVENSAMYSALFMSATIPVSIVFSPQVVTCPADFDFTCEVRKRIYWYCLVSGMASHMLCITLAMAFVNALNEAARDSDVFRMFARGQGFKATVKCMWSFRVGAACAFVSVIASSHVYMGWEAIVYSVILMIICGRVLKQTAGLLFKNGSIVNYWRTELGGHPDEDDPYDLHVPMERFHRRARFSSDFESSFTKSRAFFANVGSLPSGDTSHLSDASNEIARTTDPGIATSNDAVSHTVVQDMSSGFKLLPLPATSPPGSVENNLSTAQFWSEVVPRAKSPAGPRMDRAVGGGM